MGHFGARANDGDGFTGQPYVPLGRHLGAGRGAVSENRPLALTLTRVDCFLPVTYFLAPASLEGQTVDGTSSSGARYPWHIGQRPRGQSCACRDEEVLPAIDHVRGRSRLMEIRAHLIVPQQLACARVDRQQI